VPSQGVLGGYPGDTNRYVLVRNAGADRILDAGTHVPGPEDLVSGEVEQTLNHIAGVALGPTDVFHQVTGGGSGWKDPLLREPERGEADRDGAPHASCLHAGPRRASAGPAKRFPCYGRPRAVSTRPRGPAIWYIALRGR
jgi:hypothetical protein